MATFDCHVCAAQYVDPYRHWLLHPACRPCPAALWDDNISSDEEDFEQPGLSLAELVSTDIRREQIANDLADMRFEHGLDNAGVVALKAFVKGWIEGAAKQSVHALKHLMLPGVDRDSVTEALTVDLFADLQTEKQELAHMRRGKPYLEPRVVDLGDKEHVGSFNIIDLIIRKLQHDPKYRKAVLAKSDEWKRGELWKKVPDGPMKGFDDGVAARFHPHLMRPATNDEKDDVRFALDLNADDVEVRV